MTTVYTGAKYRTGSQAFLKTGYETGMLAPHANALGVSPALSALGYVENFSFRLPQGSQGIEALGSYRDVDIVRGAQQPGCSFSMVFGSAGFARNALRSSGISPNFKCLPVLSVAGGAQAQCSSGDAMTWQIRYGLINSCSISMQNGSATPVRAQFDIMGIATDPNAASETITESEIIAAAGSTLTWHHCNWIINGVTYRNILQSVSVAIQNGVHPSGPFREETDWTDPLSGAPTQLNPGQEKLQVSYRLFDRLPGILFDAAASAGNWGAIQLVADNRAARGGSIVNSQALTMTIANNMLASHDLEQVAPGQDFGFSASTTSNQITIAVA